MGEPAIKDGVYIPLSNAPVSMQELAEAMTFWQEFGVKPVRVPGLFELVDELKSKGSNISIDDCERLRYLMCYEIGFSDDPVFDSSVFWSTIRCECRQVVELMNDYYPGREWI